MRAIVTCACFIGMVIAAEARLGETSAQLEIRYGRPVKTLAGKRGPGNAVLMFQKGDIAVEARLDDGVTSYICYRKKTVFTDAQVQEILNRNADGETWGSPIEDAGKTPKDWTRQWLREDGGKAMLGQCLGIFRPAKTPEDCWGLHLSAGNGNVASWGQGAPRTDAKPHLDAIQTAEKEIAIQGTLGGIGAGLMETNGRIVVFSIFPATPAERAGLRPGSEIKAINGITTKGMRLADAVKLIRGPAGSAVSLDLITPAGTPSRLDVTRGKIVLGKPQASMCRSTIGLLKLSTFNRQTAVEARRAVRQLLAQGAKALIIDLRDCGGGDIRVKRDVASMFLPKGAPLWLVEDSRSGERKLIRSPVKGEFTELPLVVLVDKNTLGELPAAAIKRNRRGEIVGQTTSGASLLKSLVKNPDGSSHLEPVGKLFMTAGQPITGVGVAPDTALPPEITETSFINAAVAQLEKSHKPSNR